MKFLMIGAGALGAYFGARLLAVQQDVTFLLRPRRVAQLARTGLVLNSPRGNLRLPPPPYLLAGQIQAPFDVVIVGCKSYDLVSTMEEFAPAIGPDSVILPLLNGMRHLDQLTQRFGAQHVLGGVCQISAALDQNGAVMHLIAPHKLAFGELDGTNSARTQAIAAVFASANFESEASSNMVQEMWEKWIFIATAAGITSLMRASLGDIIAAGFQDLSTQLFAECSAIAAHHGFPPRPRASAMALAVLSTPGSLLTASMFKDIERGATTEAEHILGDLLSRSGPLPAPLLRIAYAHLKTYETRRAREAQQGAAQQ